MLDQLNGITSQRAQQVAFKVVDALQQEPPGHQVAAASLVFLMMCKRFNARPSDVLNKTEMILRDTLREGRGEYVRAIQNYIREEL